MKTKSVTLIMGLLLAAICLIPNTAAAQAASKPTKKTLAIQTTRVAEAVKAATSAAGSQKYNAMQRIAQSMDQQLVDRFHNTRKFNIVAREDIERILKEQELQSTLSDPSDPRVAKAFKLAGCEYSLVVTVDDFQDLLQHLRDEHGQILATKRTIRLSAVGKIYDNTTGILLETSNYQISKNLGAQQMDGAPTVAEVSDKIITELARLMAAKSAMRVMDVLYPAKIISLTGKQAIINRGDGTGIAKGQVWTIFATGEEMIDPDTGESLGSSEYPVGKLTISQVTPKFSRGIISEDFGVEKLHVARFVDKDDQAANAQH